MPIVPDEARTFGMEALFRAVGIYSHVGQKYEPVDMDTLLYYKEAQDGQILEEGITEAGSLSSFIAAGTAYATHGVNTIPFFIYYSMFGFQRVGDLIWAGADSRVRGFLLGGTPGRTTLAGEGLQHQDGNSHVYSLCYPNCLSYDPAYAYELAVIIQDGIRRMYAGAGERLLLPDRDERAVRDARDAAELPRGHPEGHVPLQGRGRLRRRSSRRSCSAAARSSTKWSRRRRSCRSTASPPTSGRVTSYTELYRDGHACERWNMLHPTETPQVPYVTQCLKDAPGVFVAASDYCKVLPDSIDRWMPRRIRALGTDGFGRSEDRAALREFFEVDARFVAVATLSELLKEGQIDAKVVAQAIKDLGINPDKPNPAVS